MAVENSKRKIPLDLQFQVTKNAKGQYAGRRMQGPCVAHTGNLDTESRKCLEDRSPSLT